MIRSKANPITVLCVDDSPDIIDLLAMAINREGDLKCVGCLSSASGLLQHVAELKPDVVLIDLTMPDIDPLQVVGEIRERHPATKPIVYSGYDDAATVNKALEAGACAFVSKHREMKEIFAAIRQVGCG